VREISVTRVMTDYDELTISIAVYCAKLIVSRVSVVQDKALCLMLKEKCPSMKEVVNWETMWGRSAYFP
jgi:hypothetical protein